MMIGRKELRRAFGNRPFITKGDVKKALGYSNYDQVRQYFHGLERIGNRYLTEDVIEKIMGEVEYDYSD